MVRVKKKGQTLVETVVALSILAIVLVGTITLIVNTTSLVLSARSRTEANAFAEKGLTEGINIVLNNNIPADTQKLLDENNSELSECKDVKISRSCTVVKIDKASVNGDFPLINTTPSGLSRYPDDLVEVISRVTWKDRLGTQRVDQSIELRQLVRKP